MEINTQLYPIVLDTSITKKSNTVIECQQGECIGLEVTFMDKNEIRDITDCNISFSALMYKEDNTSFFYKQDHDSIEYDLPLTQVISENKVIINLKHEFTSFISTGLAEIHITKDNHTVITQRFMIKVVDSYFGEVPSDLTNSFITIDALSKALDDIKELNSKKHSHENKIVLDELSDVEGILHYKGSVISGGNGDVTTEYLEENYYNKEKANELLNNKVDKEEGKGLSTNDFTDEYKDKLDKLNNYDDSAIKELIVSLQEKINDLNQRIEALENNDCITPVYKLCDVDGNVLYDKDFNRLIVENDIKEEM